LERLRVARKEIKSQIRKAKREMWQTFLTCAERDDVWKALEFTKRAINIALLVLHDKTGNTGTSIEQKRQTLLDHAFPMPPSDPSNEYIFKPAGHFHKMLTNTMIALSIWGQATKNLPGRDGIGPAGLRLLRTWGPGRITALFRACIQVGIHPSIWKRARGALIA
jgi:hypothetical protein